MQRITAYFAVLGWMLVIFFASTDIGSSQRTSRIIGPLLKWLKPDISEETIKAVQAVVRKSGHVSEYAILAALFWRARRISGALRGWPWREFWIVVAVCAAYAGSDELHQLFVSSRQASIVDVMIDTAGATAGLLLLWGVGHWRNRW